MMDNIKAFLTFVLICFLCIGCEQAQSLEKTEHGWKGKYLTITRMVNRLNGQRNLEIKENEFRALIDRIEVLNIIEKHNGFILNGDAFGLDYVIFKGMDTKTKQDSIIKIILPELEKWYAKQ